MMTTIWMAGMIMRKVTKMRMGMIRNLPPRLYRVNPVKVMMMGMMRKMTKSKITMRKIVSRKTIVRKAIMRKMRDLPALPHLDFLHRVSPVKMAKQILPNFSPAMMMMIMARMMMMMVRMMMMMVAMMVMVMTLTALSNYPICLNSAYLCFLPLMDF